MALPFTSETTRPERSQALVETRVREVFQRLPLLLGFTLDHDLALSDLELRTWPGHEWGDEVYKDVAAEISRLLTEVEDEKADEFVRGRTFARYLH